MEFSLTQKEGFPTGEGNGLSVPGLGPGHLADDVRVSGVRDGEGAHPEVLPAGGSQLVVVPGVLVDTGLGQHGIVLDLGFPEWGSVRDPGWKKFGSGMEKFGSGIRMEKSQIRDLG